MRWRALSIGVVVLAFSGWLLSLTPDKVDQFSNEDYTREIAFVDPSTGLPYASVDLWEQTDGQHSYSAAATYGGLAACAAMAARHEPALEALSFVHAP